MSGRAGAVIEIANGISVSIWWALGSGVLKRCPASPRAQVAGAGLASCNLITQAVIAELSLSACYDCLQCKSQPHSLRRGELPTYHQRKCLSHRAVLSVTLPAGLPGRSESTMSAIPMQYDGGQPVRAAALLVPLNKAVLAVMACLLYLTHAVFLQPAGALRWTSQ